MTKTALDPRHGRPPLIIHRHCFSWQILNVIVANAASQLHGTTAPADDFLAATEAEMPAEEVNSDQLSVASFEQESDRLSRSQFTDC